MPGPEIILLILLIAGVCYVKYKLPTIKGKVGETSVAAALSFLPRNKYVILNNQMYKLGDRSTQIDHIVISVYGIFIIETKNYKGWIYGHTNNDYWTQNIWGNKYSLYNPILQNQSHIKFLVSKFNAVREKSNAIFPITVFIRATRLQIYGPQACVLRLHQLNRYITSFRQEIMSLNECENIARILETENITDRKERSNHNRRIKTTIRKYEQSLNNRTCPKCGGRLILRNGKYGDFYGCANYPNCRYTLK